MTDLVTQGIHQVLGITARSSNFGVDLDIYQLIDQINVRLDKLEKDHIDTAQNLYQYVPRLENRLRENTLTTDNIQELLTSQEVKCIVEGIVNELYLNHAESGIKQQALEEKLEKIEDIQSIVSNIAEENTSTAKQEVPSLIAGEEKLPKNTQLELVTLEDKKKNLPTDAQKIDSTEMLKVLREADSSKGWNSQLLTNHRRLKKYLDKWHKCGSYQFKYAGEEKELGKTKHLWWIVQLNTAKNS
jgi:hypothetical protein